MATIWKAGISDSCHRFHGLTHQTEIKWSWDVFTSPRTGGSPMEAEHPSRIVGAGHTIYSHTSVLYPIKPHFPHCFLYVSYFPYLSHKNPWKLRVAGSPQARPTKLHLLNTPMLQSFSQLYGMGSLPQLDLRLQKGFNIWIPNYMWPCGRYAGNLLPTLPLVSFREVETTSQNSSLGYSNSRASDLHWFLSAQALSRYDISVPSSHWQSLLLKNQLKHLWRRSYMLYTPCTSDSPSCGSVPGRDSHVDGYLPRYVEHASLRQMVSSLIQNIQDTCPLDWLSGSFAVHKNSYSGDTSLQSLLYISHIPPFQPTHLELVELECPGFLNWKGHSSGLPGSWIEAGL